MPRSSSTLVMALMLLGASGAFGQTLERRGFQAVEQIWDDTDPLARGLRRIEGSRVYRRAHWSGSGPEKLYYIAPGVVAEYDRSDYGLFEVKKNEYRIFQLIPPNTVFHIGLPPEQPTEPFRPSPLSLASRIDTRIHGSIERETPSPSSAEPDMSWQASRQQWTRYLAESEQRQQAVLAALDDLESPSAPGPANER
jgi:hypothetical protein